MKKLLIVFVYFNASVVCYGFLSFAFMKKENEDDSLFKKIKAPYAVAREETDFWLRQMREHALFIHLGINDADFNKQAKSLYYDYENFEKLFKRDPKLDLEIMLSFLKKQRKLQVAILEKLKSGEWIGWLYPSLIEHMTMELDYFVNKLNGKVYSLEDEAAFWSEEAHGRIGVIAHLLDPSENKLVKKAMNIADKYFYVPEHQKEDFIQSALEAVKAINAFSKNYDANKQNILSIINDILASHEMREGNRAEEVLQSLGKNKKN